MTYQILEKVSPNLDVTDDTSFPFDNSSGCETMTAISLFSGCGGMDLGILGNFSYLGKHYHKNPYQVALILLHLWESA